MKPNIGESEYAAEYKAGRPHPFATEIEMDAGDFAGPALFRFGAAGRTLVFGPKDGFFGKQEKIRSLSFGLEDADLFKYAEGTVAGTMNAVDAEPIWP